MHDSDRDAACAGPADRHMRAAVYDRVAPRAGLTIDHFALPSLVEIDLAENVLGPARRFEFCQRSVDRYDVIHQHAMHDLIGEHCGRVDRSSATESLDDITRERLTDRRVVEHPIEIRRVPKSRVAHRRGGRYII